MRFLVTGCYGYIGSHVVAELKNRNHQVYGIDCKLHNEYNETVFKKCNYVCEENFIDKGINEYLKVFSYDAVIHLAGSTSVPDSMNNPFEYTRNNVFGTKKILDEIDTKHIIFAGTAASYENASPYAQTKSIAEQIIRNNKKMGWTIFRFFNVCGSDGINRQLGPASHLIRIIAEYAVGKRDKLQVFGNDYDTRDGTCIRDYIHVIDLANAICNAAEKGPINSNFEELGSKKGWTVLEVIKEFEKAVGFSLNYTITNRREGDAIAAQAQNPSKLLKLQKSIRDMCLDQYNLELKRHNQ